MDKTVNFVSNYDETEKEPQVLPVRVPNLLINGAEGIAVGMSTSIPTHNLAEVCDTCIAYIKNRFSYEALVVKNNELKEIKTDLQTTGLVKMQQYKELSNRSAVIKKLAEMGSSVSEARTPPIVIEK